MSKNESKQFNGLTNRVWDFAELVLKNRLAKALKDGVSRYPIFRELRFAARIELEVLLDAVALDPAWRAERIHAQALILDADGLSRSRPKKAASAPLRRSTARCARTFS